MKVTIPFAVADRNTEPSSASATIVALPPASASPGPTIVSGQRPEAWWTISVVAPYTSSVYATHTDAAAAKRPSSSDVRPSGRTTSGCSEPRSASPRTAPSVRKTASTVARKRIANIPRPSIVEAASPVASSVPMLRPTVKSPARSNTFAVANANKPRNSSVSSSTTANTRRRTLSRSA